MDAEQKILFFSQRKLFSFVYLKLMELKLDFYIVIRGWLVKNRHCSGDNL